MDIIQVITDELKVEKWQVEAAVKLIDEGCTIPFISRYRKEATGSLNDEQLRSLHERLLYLRNLEDKKKQVLVKEDEKVVCTLRMEKELQAPVKKGQEIGRVIFSLGEVILDEYPVVSDRNIGKITYIWCINKVFHDFFH